MVVKQLRMKLKEKLFTKLKLLSHNNEEYWRIPKHLNKAQSSTILHSCGKTKLLNLTL